MKITKKYIFEQRLKGEPIVIHTDQVSDEDVQALLDYGVVSSLNEHKESGHLVARAADRMISIHCIQSDMGPDYDDHDIFPGRLVTLRHRQK